MVVGLETDWEVDVQVCLHRLQKHIQDNSWHVSLHQNTFPSTTTPEITLCRVFSLRSGQRRDLHESFSWCYLVGAGGQWLVCSHPFPYLNSTIFHPQLQIDSPELQLHELAWHHSEEFHLSWTWWLHLAFCLFAVLWHRSWERSRDYSKVHLELTEFINSVYRYCRDLQSLFQITWWMCRILRGSTQDVCTFVVFTSSINNLNSFHTLSVHSRPPPGMFACWIWCIQYRSDAVWSV